MRIHILDALRGVSVLAMLFYHFLWDMGYFNFIELDTITQGLPLLFAQSVGASFIIISGISSRLLCLSDDFITKFFKRLGVLLFICALITSVTFFLNKNSFIFFGILHFLTICSVISLLLIRIRNSYALFFLFALSVVVSSVDLTFNLPNYLSWLGFNIEVPITNDFYPLFPWLSFYLMGIWAFDPARNYLGKYLKNGKILQLSNNTILRSLQFLGKHSLIIYILHQPVFFSLFFIFIQLTS